VIWVLLGVGSVVVAGVYTFIWPRPKPGVMRSTSSRMVLRWGHAVVWLLLAVSFFMRAVGAEVDGLANLIAFAAGLLYIAFIASAVIDRRL